MKRHVEYASQFFLMSQPTPGLILLSHPLHSLSAVSNQEEEEVEEEVCRHSQRAEEPKTVGDAIT